MAAHRCEANVAFQRRRGCNVRPGELTASCAAAAAVAAAVKAISAGPPRAHNEFSKARTQTKPLDPKSICKQLSKPQPCPPSTRPRANTGAGTGEEPGKEAGAGTGGESGAGAGTCAAGPNVLNIKAHICIDLNPNGQGSREPCPPSQQESSGSQGRGSRPQELCLPSKQEPSGSQERGPRSQESCPPSQQESAGSQKRSLQSQDKVQPVQAAKCVAQDSVPNKTKSGSSQVLGISRLDKSQHSVGSCVCDGKVTPANASFKARTARFLPEAPDVRPWYCNTPNFHESTLPKTPRNPAPPNAPFFHSAARFSSDTRFKAPAPNTYLPPVMSKVRWSGILTGYHGIPTCYNVVDRNCDLSTVHMHCVMCPPRGVYNKSIGLPLHEIYPDNKQRDERLRHMCTWHTGEVKRAYHERGMFAPGCTDGIEGRTDIGPSGFRTGNIGCSCTRRDNQGGVLDDAILEKMAEALNRKKRDPDTFAPSAVCLKFAEESTGTDAAQADKLQRDRAEDCNKKGSGKDTLRGPAMKPSEPRPSRIGEPVEGRLASVTECGEEAQLQWSDEDAATKLSSRASKKSSRVVSEKSGAASRESEEAVTGADIPEVAADSSVPLTVKEYPQERIEDTCSVRPSRMPSMISGASTIPASADNCSTDTGRKSVGTTAEDGVSCQSGSTRQSLGTDAQSGAVDGMSGTGPCQPITFECNCALYNRNVQNMTFPPAPQGGEQRSRTADGQQYGLQGQYASPYADQQCGSSGQTYGARVKLCFAPEGQSTGANTKQYCPQGQSYGQQYFPQAQQYGVQQQQPQQYSQCSSCAPCFASQQLSHDGNSRSSSVRRECIPPTSMPACPTNPCQGSGSR